MLSVILFFGLLTSNANPNTDTSSIEGKWILVKAKLGDIIVYDKENANGARKSPKDKDKRQLDDSTRHFFNEFYKNISVTFYANGKCKWDLPLFILNKSEVLLYKYQSKEKRLIVISDPPDGKQPDTMQISIRNRIMHLTVGTDEPIDLYLAKK